jgi:hypothetical protein
VRRPAQQRVQARHQLAQVERLGQIVVGAGLQTGDPVVDGVAGREHADRDVVAERAQCGHHGHAVEFGHLDVENQRVVILAREQPQRLLPGRRDPDVEPRMAQSARHRGSDVRIVVDHQDGAAGAIRRGLLPCRHYCRGRSELPQRVFRSISG